MDSKQIYSFTSSYSNRNGHENYFTKKMISEDGKTGKVLEDNNGITKMYDIENINNVSDMRFPAITHILGDNVINSKSLYNPLFNVKKDLGLPIYKIKKNNNVVLIIVIIMLVIYIGYLHLCR
tara:strand:- start:20 stop:388 length:369 start_codon:yes stop_codon:yes gene_type:complete